MNRLVVAAVLLLGCGVASAGKYNKTRNIGDPAPVWKNLPGTDGKAHSLADLKDKDVVVVVFTCNSCPVAQEYEDRIIAFAKKYAGAGKSAELVAINVNRIPEDRLPKMKERAEQKGFPFTYLYDESQATAKEFGALFTPEFFVLDKDRKIAYMGGMDDNSAASQVTEHYLEPAVQAILNGDKPSLPETVARGCLVRYARDRRPAKSP